MTLKIKNKTGETVFILKDSDNSPKLEEDVVEEEEKEEQEEDTNEEEEEDAVV